MSQGKEEHQWASHIAGKELSAIVVATGPARQCHGMRNGDCISAARLDQVEKSSSSWLLYDPDQRCPARGAGVRTTKRGSAAKEVQKCDIITMKRYLLLIFVLA